jgi:hypothetical protein
MRGMSFPVAVQRRAAVGIEWKTMATDKIGQIVDRAIAYTEDILRNAPHHYRVAHDGLERMRQSLIPGAEEHPALRVLEKYILDLERRHFN